MNKQEREPTHEDAQTDEYVEHLNTYIANPLRDGEDALREVVDGVGIVLNDENDALPQPRREERR